MSDSKICSKCGIRKPLEDFYPNIKSNDGLEYWCKDCFTLRKHNQYHHKPLNLKPNDINFLIDRYKELLKTEKDKEIRSKYFLRIKNLKIELGRVFNSQNVSYTKSSNNITNNIKSLCKNILIKKCSRHNTSLIAEAERIVDNLCRQMKWNESHTSNYSNELFAIVVITELLNKYNIRVNELELLNEYDIPVDKFVRLSICSHKWLEKNYW